MSDDEEEEEEEKHESTTVECPNEGYNSDQPGMRTGLSHVFYSSLQTTVIWANKNVLLESLNGVFQILRSAKE